MPITNGQLERRKQHIGSSDMAAIMGLDPFRTAYDVWISKTGRLKKNGNSTKAMERGNFLETAILNWFESTTGKKIIRNQYRSAKNEGIPFGTNTDAIVRDEGAPVEGKSVGNYSQEVWGEPDTDEMPDRVIVQSFVHMICMDAPICYVPVYLPYRDFQLFHVDYRPDLATVIIAAGLNFWENHVLKDIPPENALPSIDIAKRIRKQPNKTVSISAGLIAAYEETQAFVKEAKEKKERAQAAILAALDGAEEGIADNGRRVTNFTQKRKGYTVEDTEFAVLRFPKK